MKRRLDGLYRKYNRPEFVDPDPLQLVLRYEDPLDREIVGMVASGLAFGRVDQIVNSVERVLEALDRPREAVVGLSRTDLDRRLAGFRHRFVAESDMVDLLVSIGCICREFGSLGALFVCGLAEDHATVLEALADFVDALLRRQGREANYLIPRPEKGSACKRLNLFLRWMVRRDAVDPGGWLGVSARQLIVPLDTHMHRVARELEFTRRRQADMRTALEVTAAFRRLAPHDPVRYDFSLTRSGIWASRQGAPALDTRQV